MKNKDTEVGKEPSVPAVIDATSVRNYLFARLEYDSENGYTYTNLNGLITAMPWTIFCWAKQYELEKDEELKHAVAQTLVKRQAQLLTKAMEDSKNYKLAYAAMSEQQDDKEKEEKKKKDPIQINIVGMNDAITADSILEQSAVDHMRQIEEARRRIAENANGYN